MWWNNLYLYLLLPLRQAPMAHPPHDTTTSLWYWYRLRSGHPILAVYTLASCLNAICLELHRYYKLRSWYLEATACFCCSFFFTKLNQYMFLGVTEQWFSHENRIIDFSFFDRWRRRWMRGCFWLRRRRRKGMSSTAQSSNAAGNFYVQPWLKHLLLRLPLPPYACWNWGIP